MSTIIQSISDKFTTPVINFYSTAATGISDYVMPMAWTALALGLLIWAYTYATGKTQVPITDLLTKYMYALVLLYMMSGAYLGWVADPLFNMGDQITAVLPGGAGTPLATLGQLFDKMVDTMSLIFSAGADSLLNMAWGTAIQLFIWGILLSLVCMILLALTLVMYLFAKIGMSLTLAFGPFFMFGLISQHTKNYFYAWLNTALYFVFYQVMIVAFIGLFLSILDSYFTDFQTQIGTIAFDPVQSVLNLLSMGGSDFNLMATLGPVLIISLVMFFTLLQIPQLVSSMTSGSGGGFGNGAWMLSNIMRRGGGGAGKTGGGGSAKPLMLPPPK